MKYRYFVYIFLMLLGSMRISHINAQTTPPNAVLPLQPSSVVMTHSPCMITMQCGTNNTNNVVSIMNMGNTANIPTSPSTTPSTRYVWTQFTASNPKPLWESRTNWTETNMGRVFGLAIDEDRNIYVSNTSIYEYEGTSGHNDAVWRIDANSGAVSVAIQFPSNFNRQGLGNIKMMRLGNNNFMAISNWEDGRIYMFQQTPTGWVRHDDFTPTFGSVSPPNGTVPYGVAFRTFNNGNGQETRLYYGNVSLTTDFTAESGLIFSIGIDATGRFMQNTQRAEPLSPLLNTTRTTKSAGVSDIAFSDNGRKMILAQQKLNAGALDAHYANVEEYVLTNNVWERQGVISAGHPIINPGHPAYVNNTANPNIPIGIVASSAVGGVTYYDFRLYDSLAVGCDTTILYTSDYIYYDGDAANRVVPPNDEISSPANNLGSANSSYKVYGLQGVTSLNNGGFSSYQAAFNASFKVDANDEFGNHTKRHLGDIEAVNNLCRPACSCGQWNWLRHNGRDLDLNAPVLSFLQGQVATAGSLEANYACQPPNVCLPSYTWAWSGNIRNGNTFELKDLQKLPCGNYELTLTPTCASMDCPPIVIKIEILCVNPCICKVPIQVSLDPSSVIIKPHTTFGSNSVDMLSYLGLDLMVNAGRAKEIRVLIDEFRLSANQENCLLCINPPRNWGNILNLNPDNKFADAREWVINSQGVIDASNYPIHLDIGLPDITELECCEVQVFLCIKVSVLDTDCCESEATICETFMLQSKDKGNSKRLNINFKPFR
ncbi:MAG: hypothetical protein ACKVTZ_05510 [Bacteroidia bacterium]